MSAQLANASADFTLGDVSVHLSCSSAQELLTALAAFGKAPAANQPTIAPKADKPAATPAPTAAPVLEGNASASTGTQASAPAAASGSAPAGEASAVDYKQVQQKVLALSKVSVALAKATLAKFTGVNGQPVDHGTKLQLPDYAAFIAAADAELKGAGK